MAITTFMNLNLPVPTVTLGPAWATQLNAAMERVDQHDHTSGNGVKITVPALDINTDLSFKSNNATSLNSTRFINNSSVLSGLQDIRSLYVSGGDLYYNNSSGTNIRITSGGALDAASIGGIGGDYATSSASVFYTNASDLFTFDQDTNTRAKLDTADITIREAVASAEGITLRSPTSLSASYNITMPSGQPASGTKFVTMDSSGNLGVSYDVDDSTLEVSGSTIQMKNLGTTTAKLADLSVTTAKIAASNVTKAKLGNTLVSSASDSATTTTTSSSFVSSGISVSNTTNSNKMLIVLESISGSILLSNTNNNASLRVLRGGTVIKTVTSTDLGSVLHAVFPFSFLDTGASVGASNSYTLEFSSSGGTTASLDCKMSLIEIL